jgi:hypothetical protein
MCVVSVEERSGFPVEAAAAAPIVDFVVAVDVAAAVGTFPVRNGFALLLLSALVLAVPYRDDLFRFVVVGRPSLHPGSMPG